MQITRKNSILAFTLQIVTIAYGFIIPKIILLYFGSEINGIISSISQFLNYAQLFEGGIGAVIMASLYKPLSEKDSPKISGVVIASKKFFRQFSMVLLCFSGIVAVIFPLVFVSNYPFIFVFSLVLIIAANSFMQYSFSATYKLLLNADNRGYIVSTAQMIYLCISLMISVLSVSLYPSIHLLMLIRSLTFVIVPIILTKYVSKNYQLNNCVLPDNDAIKHRWDAFGQNLAYFIHNNTDIVVLTVFSSFANVSVYAVYSMIILALRNLIKAVSDAIAPSIGKIFVCEDRDTIIKKFDQYEMTIGIIATLFFSACAVLIVPFVRLYTAGITDADYIQPVFAYILTFAQFIYSYRDSYGNVIYIAGHIKETSIYAYIESGINIVTSMILVFRFGLIGIAIGTAFAMLFRMLAMIIYTNKIILKRSLKKSANNLGLFLSSGIISVFILNSIHIQVSNYLYWIFFGIMSVIIIAFVEITLLLIFRRHEIICLVKCFKA